MTFRIIQFLYNNAPVEEQYAINYLVFIHIVLPKENRRITDGLHKS